MVPPFSSAGPDGRDARIAELEAELTAARAEIDAVRKAGGLFMRKAGHDLRQPFQAIQLFLHLLLMRLSNDQAMLELAQRIQEAVQAAEAGVSGLIDLSSLEAGMIQIDSIRVKPSEILEALVRELEVSAGDKGLRLRHVPSRAIALADPVLLERMLRHLLVNAIRFTDHGGVLAGARRGPPGMLRIQVWDTGIGIAPAETETVFEPFRHANQPAAKRAQGLGLGLAVVRRAAEAQGGTVSLRSIPGKGTVVTLDLPSGDPEPRAAAPAPPVPVPAVPAPTVLVIEDDAVQLMAMRLLLEGWGYRVVSASGGNRALAALATARAVPDIVISDLWLRDGIGGIDAVAAVREAVGAAVPAVLVTGDIRSVQERLGADAGLRLLQKPFGADALRTVLDTALKGG